MGLDIGAQYIDLPIVLVKSSSRFSVQSAVGEQWSSDFECRDVETMERSREGQQRESEIMSVTSKLVMFAHVDSEVRSLGQASNNISRFHLYLFVLYLLLVPLLSCMKRSTCNSRSLDAW